MHLPMSAATRPTIPHVFDLDHTSRNADFRRIVANTILQALLPFLRIVTLEYLLCGLDTTRVNEVAVEAKAPILEQQVLSTDLKPVPASKSAPDTGKTHH